MVLTHSRLFVDEHRRTQAWRDLRAAIDLPQVDGNRGECGHIRELDRHRGLWRSRGLMRAKPNALTLGHGWHNLYRSN